MIATTDDSSPPPVTEGQTFHHIKNFAGQCACHTERVRERKRERHTEAGMVSCVRGMRGMLIASATPPMYMEREALKPYIWLDFSRSWVWRCRWFP